jgi:catechol 2,3-dioxygenase-like lactoylglutathione lyase family enzyme
MNITHSGLAASSEEKADSFFIDILGLEKSTPKILDKELAHAIFGINDELSIIHYQGGNVHYEILVYQHYKAPENQIAHSCIQVPDLSNIVNKCRDAGMKVVEIPKGSVVLTFISDYDGNLFEVKE